MSLVPIELTVSKKGLWWLPSCVHNSREPEHRWFYQGRVQDSVDPHQEAKKVYESTDSNLTHDNAHDDVSNCLGVLGRESFRV